jgi:hypothetical protein
MASDAMGVAFSNRRTPAKLSMGKSAKVVGATNLRQNNEGTGENCPHSDVTSPSGMAADELKVACLLEKHNYAETARILVVDPHAAFDR